MRRVVIPEVSYLSFSYLLGAAMVLGLIVAPIAFMFIR